jgi:hypothetical protein
VTLACGPYVPETHYSCSKRHIKLTTGNCFARHSAAAMACLHNVGTCRPFPLDACMHPC